MKEALQDAKMEADSAQTKLLKFEEATVKLLEAEEKMHALKRAVRTHKHDEERYRRWWLTEYHSLKLVLQLIPNPEDVEAISASSKARFASYSTGL